MLVRQTIFTGLIALSLSVAAAAPGIPYLPAELGPSSFVITAAGELYAWGYNEYGELGIGTTGSPVLAPVLVPRPQGVRSWRAVAGGQGSAAIGDDGNLYRWGNTNYASSSGGFQLTPLLVPKPSNVGRWLYVARDYGSTLIALANDRNLYQWDSRHPVDPLLVPKPEGVSSWLKVTTGRSYYLALAANGELFDWGTTPRKLARPEGVTRWIDASSGVTHDLALGDNGELYQQDYTWPTPPRRLVPRPANVTRWKSMSASWNVSAAIGSDDRLYIWFSVGQPVRPVPVSFPQPVRKWISVAAGTTAALMIGDDCHLYSWGYGDGSQVGTGNTITYRVVPVLVKNLEHLCVPAVPETEPGALTLAPLPPLFQREREFRFYVLGNAAEPFVLFRSPDLEHWMPLSTNPPLAGWRALSDTNVGSAAAFFYRVAPP